MKKSSKKIPVITIDGPSGSGKGTLATLLAKKIGWHVLNSGTLYRLIALHAVNHAIDINDEASLKVLAKHLHVQFNCKKDLKIIFNNAKEHNLQTEEVGAIASRVAELSEVRKVLLQFQQDFAQMPGLVADGRDMGSVVFPEANVKIYLTASPEKRAKRRQNQLHQQGIYAKFDRFLADVFARDNRDMHRNIAPLQIAINSIVLDSTELNIQEVYSYIIDIIRRNNLI